MTDKKEETNQETEQVAIASMAAEQLLSDEPEGLTTKEYEQSLAQHGYNEVVTKEPLVILQLLSRYLGIVPLFIMTTAALSAAIESDCTEGELYVFHVASLTAF